MLRDVVCEVKGMGTEFRRADNYHNDPWQLHAGFPKSYSQER
jgi:hypothetical protein